MKHKYHPLFTKINACLPNSSKIILEKTKRVSDRFKLIGNISCATIRKSTNRFTIQDEQTLHRSSNLLHNIISCKKLDFILDKEAEVKIQLLNNNNADISYKNLITEFFNSLVPRINPNLARTKQSTEGIKNFEKNQHTLAPIGSSNTNTNQTSIGEVLRTTGRRNSTCMTSKPSTTSSAQVLKVITKKATVQNVSELTSKHKLQDYVSKMIRQNICLEGGNIMEAIEILRSYKT